MPKYSDNYKNGVNVGAVRHLLGAVPNGAYGNVPRVDVSNAHVQWSLGLRYYQPERDLSNKRPNRENLIKFKDEESQGRFQHRRGRNQTESYT